MREPEGAPSAVHPANRTEQKPSKAVAISEEWYLADGQLSSIVLHQVLERHWRSQDLKALSQTYILVCSPKYVVHPYPYPDLANGSPISSAQPPRATVEYKAKRFTESYSQKKHD